MDSRERSNRRLRQLGEKGACISELQLYVEYFKRLSIEQYEMREVLSRIQVSLEEKRSEVVEAMKSRKILENLKEKRWRAHRAKIKKKEMAAADEMAISLFNRPKK